MTVAAVFAIYGVLLLLEASVGYRQAGNKTSLVPGIVTGFILLVAAVMVLTGVPLGPSIGIGATLAMLGHFGSRYSQTKTFYPNGLMLAASVIAIAILFTQVFT